MNFIEGSASSGEYCVFVSPNMMINRPAYKSDLDLKGKAKCGLGYSPPLEIVTDYSFNF